MKNWFSMLSYLVVAASLSFAALSDAKDLAYTDKEIIRNGDFELGKHTWHAFRCDCGSWYAKDGEKEFRLGSLGGNLYEERYFFQQLILPSQLESATLRMEMKPSPSPSPMYPCWTHPTPSTKPCRKGGRARTAGPACGQRHACVVARWKRLSFHWLAYGGASR